VLTKDIDDLTSVTSAVAAKRDALAEVLDNAPVALSNVGLAYNPGSGTLDTRTNITGLDDPALLICALVTGPTGTGNTNPNLCSLLQTLIPKLPIPGVLNLPGLSAIPEALSVPQAAAALAPEPAAPAADPDVTVRGADATLGGLLPKEKP